MRFLSVLAIFLIPVPSFGIGEIYAGIGGRSMRPVSAKVHISIENQIAVTYVEQVFRSNADWPEEGVYEFDLPDDAIITDLWLWIEGEPVQGFIMEKDAARQAYEEVVDRSIVVRRDPIDPALIEHLGDNDFVMRIYPFPERGTRRVAMEYAQILPSRDGRIDYTLALLPDRSRGWWVGVARFPTIEEFVLKASVRSQHPMTVTTLGIPHASVYRTPSNLATEISVRYVDHPRQEDFQIVMERTDDDPLMPALFSYGPGHHEATDTYQVGYYLLWAPGYFHLSGVSRSKRESDFLLQDFVLETMEDEAGDIALHDEHVLLTAYDKYGTSQAGRYEAGGPVSMRLDGRRAGEEVSETYEDRLIADADSAYHSGSYATRFIPRLWAYHKIMSLERHAESLEGCPTGDLLQEMVDLAIAYRLVTRHTSLFAPDENVQIDPEVRQRKGWGSGGATDVNTSSTTTWFGRDFIRRDGRWIDATYQSYMPREIYDGQFGQPALLSSFAELGQEMVVVVNGRAYEIQPGRPILHQNAPNPFNASTVITIVLPIESPDEARLGIYNLQGQHVRTLPMHGVGRHTVTWDGLDAEGRPAASGVYVYRLERGEWSVNRRMLLLR